MTTVKHAKQSGLPADDGSSSHVRPSDWYADHTVTNLPGEELDYVEITTPVAVTATSEGSPTDVITSNSVDCDGSPIWAEFFTPLVDKTSNGIIYANLYEDGTSLGRMFHVGLPVVPSSDYRVPLLVRRRLTPSAGPHTFAIKAVSASGDGYVEAGAGGPGNQVPAYLCITRV